VLKHLAVLETSGSDEAADVLPQTIAFWEELLQNPEANRAGRQYLLGLQLRWLDQRIARGEEVAEDALSTALCWWAAQLAQEPADRLPRYALSLVLEKLPAVYPSGIPDAAVHDIYESLISAAGEQDRQAVIELIQTACARGKFTFAARLWGEVLAGEPALGDDRENWHRYNAACAASLAAAGRDQDEPPLDDAAKACLRRQALDWLNAELAAWTKVRDADPTALQTSIAPALRQWVSDPDLARIRDEQELLQLPAEEQAAFKQLWLQVAALLATS
jgi:hypothetical protein